MMNQISTRPKVILLDVIETLLNIEGIKGVVSKLMGNRAELGEAWFSNMLLYSQVDTLTDSYHDFWKIACASFEMIAQSHHIEYNSSEAFELIKRINVSPAHPDVADALASLKASGYQLATFTNSSKAGVHIQLTTNHLDSYIDQIISTDDIGYFKPHPHTYRMAASLLGVQPEDCLLIASHGWDIAGASHVGMKTAFLHRNQYALYPLAPKPDFYEVDLKVLADKLCLL